MRKFLFIILVLVLLISSTMIIYYIYQSSHHKKVYDDLARSYHGDEKGDGFKDLHRINGDIIGWIQVPGTRIDYPVVQGEDNAFYLDHDIYRNDSRHGSIFMDYRNDPKRDHHIVIYGHHMRDGSMFRDLIQYKKEDFFSNYRDIVLEIQGERQKYKIFSVSVISGDSDDIKVSFSSTEEFSDYVEGIPKTSYGYRDFDFSGQEQIITLSTCSYEFDNARTVIQGVRTE